jgi:alanyl-tRNA synthetase
LAKEAIERGKEFTLLIQDLEKLDPSKVSDLDKQAGNVRKDLDAASISACIKAELRARIENIQKAASEARAKELQQKVDTIINDVKVIVQEALTTQTPFVVAGVDIGSDAKTSQKITNAVKKVAPDLPFLGISEEEPGSGGKLFVFATVPDSYLSTSPNETQLKADEWVLAALQNYNGRGGGKPNSAQAQAQTCDDVAEVYNAAKAFAQLKLANTKVDVGAK